jgi:hypothetical protein
MAAIRSAEDYPAVEEVYPLRSTAIIRRRGAAWRDAVR